MPPNTSLSLLCHLRQSAKQQLVQKETSQAVEAICRDLSGL